MRKLLVASVAGCVLAGSIALATPAIALAVTPGDYTFNFTGICTDCEGPGTATLKLTNYILGSDFDNSQIAGFSYSGSDMFPAYSNGHIYRAKGSIGSTPGEYNIDIRDYASSLGYGIYFFTKQDGTWDTGREDSADQGIAGTWSLATVATVPDPSTWIMMTVGFALIGSRMRLRKTAIGTRVRLA